MITLFISGFVTGIMFKYIYGLVFGKDSSNCGTNETTADNGQKPTSKDFDFGMTFKDWEKTDFAALKAGFDLQIQRLEETCAKEASKEKAYCHECNSVIGTYSTPPAPVDPKLAAMINTKLGHVAASVFEPCGCCLCNGLAETQTSGSH